MRCRKGAIAAFVAVAAFASSFQANALEGAAQTFDLPVPKEWRQPYGKFLDAMGVKDVGRTVDDTKFGFIGDGNVRRPDSSIFRIENKSACDDDVCFTVIAHLADGQFIADAMFVAGPKLRQLDIPARVFDTIAFQYRFEARKSSLGVVPTARGWVVVPHDR